MSQLKSLLLILGTICLGYIIYFAYIIYCVFESFIPDVHIPIILENGYRYELDYIPPKASLTEQTWELYFELESRDSVASKYSANKRGIAIDNRDDNYRDFSQIDDDILDLMPIIKAKIIKDNQIIYNQSFTFKRRYMLNGPCYEKNLNRIAKVI
ncbi:hypothetical protein BMT54_05125 [Pasteurellaceae bacterium 15-036681]|nr:hypothetical protein BMT54_05125 [Pasteurellaceae bacterium 15-036681]